MLIQSITVCSFRVTLLVSWVQLGFLVYDDRPQLAKLPSVSPQSQLLPSVVDSTSSPCSIHPWLPLHLCQPSCIVIDCEFFFELFHVRSLDIIYTCSIAGIIIPSLYLVVRDISGAITFHLLCSSAYGRFRTTPSGSYVVLL